MRIGQTGSVDLAQLRLEYSTIGLDEDDLFEDPIEQFERWLAEAIEAEVFEPNAMVVSTVDEASRPSSRHLLLKSISNSGFDFYTNQESAKARDLAGNSAVALTFPWLQLQRQVNVAGMTHKLDPSDADSYFALRPRESQLGAWASAQSTVLTGRGELEASMEEMGRRFPDEVPRPQHWGGYRVTPLEIEFWQGRQNRLHDRFRFSRASLTEPWTLSRLSP